MYYLILALPLTLYFAKLFVTNYAIPSYKRRVLRRSIATRDDSTRIFQTNLFLTSLFKINYSKILSRVFRVLQFGNNPEFIYGDIDTLGFHNILEKANPAMGEVFYDLGSGSGKAVFAAALYFDFKKCYGVELMDVLYKQSLNNLAKAKKLLCQKKDKHEYYLEKLAQINFINEDFTNYNFTDADIIYIAATCLSDTTFDTLIQKIHDAKIGTRVIVATRTIHDPAFTLIYNDINLMGWGLCRVRIYRYIGEKDNT